MNYGETSTLGAQARAGVVGGGAAAASGFNWYIIGAIAGVIALALLIKFLFRRNQNIDQ